MEKRLTWCSEIGVGGVLTFIASVIWYGKTELDCDKYRKKNQRKIQNDASVKAKNKTDCTILSSFFFEASFISSPFFG